MEKQQTASQADKMGVMPIGKLLCNMAIPMIISMLVQALYNIVDSIFVAQISEDALTAVSMAFPVQNLMIAVASGIGVGMNANLSRSLGEKNQQMADKAAMQGFILNLCGYVLFLLFGLFGTGLFLKVQTDSQSILTAATTYIQICCFCSVGLFCQFSFERMLQATGRTFYTMITQATGAIINVIMDPILIFGLFGAPRMGIAGAALATVFGQIVAALLALTYNHKKNDDIHLKAGNLKPDPVMMKRILMIGFPSILMISIGSVMNFCMNKILIAFTSTAVAVFGVYFKLQSFIMMPVFGLNNAMVPIVAFNFGAGNRARILKTVKYCVIFAVTIMLLGCAVFQIWPHVLLRLFNASDSMLEMGCTMLRIASISYIFAGFCIVIGSFFQALGRSVYSLVVSVGRQLVVLVPVAYLLSKLGSLTLVWWAIPIAELASVALSVLFLRKVIGILPKKEKEEEV